MKREHTVACPSAERTVACTSANTLNARFCMQERTFVCRNARSKRLHPSKRYVIRNLKFRTLRELGPRRTFELYRTFDNNKDQQVARSSGKLYHSASEAKSLLLWCSIALEPHTRPVAFDIFCLLLKEQLHRSLFGFLVPSGKLQLLLANLFHYHFASQ